MRSEYDAPARRALDRLTAEDKAALIAEWGKKHRGETDIAEVQMIDEYAYIMLDEIVRRAEIAANQTNEW